ncbi:MAG: insulinase family protein [Clostridia bacterium]|nr:insulinase family protein [Clostridia bacterium]
MLPETVNLGEGVLGRFIKNDRFNTTLISFNFYLPLREETVANNALLPFVLTTCSDKYPDFSKLNYKLTRLYGANLISSCEKIGDYQLLKVGISVINDKYTIDEEDLTAQACELLCDLIFRPKAENGEFALEDTEREKRKAIEHIKGEFSEKRIYAKKRLIEEMFKGSAFGISKCGTVEQVETVTGKSLYEAWQNMLKSGFVRVNVVSSEMPKGLFEAVSEAFSGIGRENVTDCKENTCLAPAENVRTVTENMDITQGKLVLGFTSKMSGTDRETLSLSLMCDIFGGGPYSRLFNNVREKLSLCYYCAVGLVKIKGFLTVDCGIDPKNEEKAIKAITDQLFIMKKGMFTDFEFESAIKSTKDSLKTYYDSQSMLDMWYSLKVFEENPPSPEELSELISKVTREDVCEAAKGIELHTVYSLKPCEVEK